MFAINGETRVVPISKAEVTRRSSAKHSKSLSKISSSISFQKAKDHWEGTISWYGHAALRSLRLVISDAATATRLILIIAVVGPVY